MTIKLFIVQNFILQKVWRLFWRLSKTSKKKCIYYFKWKKMICTIHFHLNFQGLWIVLTGLAPINTRWQWTTLRAVGWTVEGEGRGRGGKGRPASLSLAWYQHPTLCSISKNHSTDTCKVGFNGSRQASSLPSIVRIVYITVTPIDSL